MSLQKIYQPSFRTLFLLTIAFSAAAAVTVTAQQPGATPTVIAAVKPSSSLAGSNNLYCAGYVETGTVNTENEIVGAQEEQEKNIYAQNDYVYISSGANRGVKVGDVFAVIRPRGEVKTRWSRKDDLGFYVQEVGAVEVVNVKAEVSAARVISSCDNLLLGDLLQPTPARTSPAIEQSRPALSLFGDASGKASGRIFMARDNQEILTRDQIVYVDLGAEDRVNVGDRLTVFRPLGGGSIFENDEKERIPARDGGFQSRRFRGGKFSNQAARKSGNRAQGSVVSKEDAREGRPANLRKVVGELVILNVKEKTATAVITRTAQEIYTGDGVELQ